MRMRNGQRALALAATAALMAIGVTSTHAAGRSPRTAVAPIPPTPTQVEYKLSSSKTAVPHGIQVLVYLQTKSLMADEVEKKPLYWRAKVDGHIWAQYQTDAFPGHGQGEQFAPVFHDGTGKHHIRITVVGQGTVKDIHVSTGR